MGLSPAALYVHFPSKELVLYEIIRVGHERALESVEKPSILAVEDSPEQLGEFCADLALKLVAPGSAG